MTPDNLASWPPEMRYRYEERAAIKQDSGTPLETAEREALRETWDLHLRGEIK